MVLNSAIKTAELLIYTKTLINSIIIILGKKSQTKRNIYCMMPFIKLKNPIYSDRTQIGGYVGTEMGVGKGAEGERDYKGT